MTCCVLVGIPGSGKTTIGRELAKKLDVNFIDTDRLIEQKAGKTVANIFIEDGEPRFREIEKEVVLKSLLQEDAVVSLGGGSILDAEVRTALQRHLVFWLQTSIANAVKRTSINQNRPLLLDAPRATLIKLLEQRSGFYTEVAKSQIDTDGKTIKAIVEEIAKSISGVNAK